MALSPDGKVSNELVEVYREYARGQVADTPVILVGGHRSIESMNTLINETGIEYLSMSRPLCQLQQLLPHSRTFMSFQIKMQTSLTLKNQKRSPK